MKILVALVVLVVVVCGVGFILPSDYSVERSVVIKAEPSAIFPYLNDLKRWPEWSPWTKEKYPKMETTYHGADSGVGAESKWTDPDNGNGRMVITKSDPENGIDYDLFFDEFPKSMGTITLKPVDGGVEISMTNAGDLGGGIISNYFVLMMGPMMGGEFEDGLAKLKAVVEGAPPAS